MDYTLINKQDLPRDGDTFELEGYLYGGAKVCIILIDLPPGDGPHLHSHPYQEVFIVQEGQATYTIGAETLEIKAGQIVVVSAGVPHKFVNSGDGPLRQVDLHVNERFITEWLDTESLED